MGTKAGPKFVGGTNRANDVSTHHITAKEASGEERSNNESPCPGISCSVNSSSLETKGEETKPPQEEVVPIHKQSSTERALLGPSTPLIGNSLLPPLPHYTT